MALYSGGPAIGYLISFILWGVYTAVFVTTLWIMHTRGASKAPAVRAMIAIWLLSTINVVVDLYLFYHAFVLFPDGPDAYFIASASFQVDQWAYGVINITYILPSILTDGLLSWRAFVVWSRDRRILILPAVILLLAFISGFIVVAYDFLADKNGVLPFYANPLAYGAYIFYGANFVVTWYATILIAVRLHNVGKQTVQFEDDNRKANPYRKIILVVIESGLVLTVSIFIFSVFYILGNVYPDSIKIYNGYVVLSPIHRRLVGIVPTLLVLQLNVGSVVKRGQEAAATTHGTNETMRFAAARPRRNNDTTDTGTGLDFASPPNDKNGTFASSNLDYQSSKFDDTANTTPSSGPTAIMDEKEQV